VQRLKKPKIVNRGFSIVELLVVLGIAMILLSIVLPVLHNAHKAKHEVQCLAELRDSMVAIQLYSLDQRDFWPVSFSPLGNAGQWEGPGGISVRGEGTLGALATYWAFVLDERTVGSYPLVACPANTEAAVRIEEYADEMGLSPNGLVYPLDRALSHVFFVTPSWCSSDQEQWDPSQLQAGTVASVRYPSAKAALFDKSPFHDERWISTQFPNPPPPYRVPVAAVDGAASFRYTSESNPPILIGEPFVGDLSDLRRSISYYRLTKNGWLGRDW